MKRRTLLQAAAFLAAPAIARAQSQTTLKFIPQADVTALDPVWSTRSTSPATTPTWCSTRCMARTSTLADPSPDGARAMTTDDDGKRWRLTLRDGLLLP